MPAADASNPDSDLPTPSEEQGQDTVRPMRRPDMVGAWLDWISRHADAVALVVVAVGLLVRVLAATGTALDGDEAQHFLVSKQPGIIAAYQASKIIAHPPLFIIALNLWGLLGSSELHIRLLSVLAGTGAVWIAYKWLARALGRPAAVFGAVFLSFLPSLVRLSAEVRQYGLLLLFVASALYFYQRFLDEQSLRALALYGLFLCLAALTHYSALLLVVSLGAHTLVLLLRGKLTAVLARAWVGVQLVVGGLYLMLYLTHIKSLSAGILAQSAQGGWLSSSYFKPASQTLWTFIQGAVVGAFRFMLSSSLAGHVALWMFLLGLALLSAGLVRGAAGRTNHGRALLAAVPFVVAAVAALLRLFPFGTSRHTVFLVFFLCAGLGAVVAWGAQCRQGWSRALALAGAVFLCIATPALGYQHRDPAPDLDRVSVRHLVEYVEQVIPAGDTIFTDFEANAILGYYIGPADSAFCVRRGDFVESRYRGRTVISTSEARWSFRNRENFDEAFDGFVEEYAIAPDQEVWAVDVGWGRNAIDPPQSARLDDIAAHGFKAGSWPSASDFRSRVLKITVGSWPSPKNIRSRVIALLRDSRTARSHARALLLPLDSLSDSVRILAAGISDTVMTYDTLYPRLERRAAVLDDYLPALAIWAFDDPGRHLEIMRFMDDRENFVAGAYKFTLLGVDEDAVLGVYQIESRVGDAIEDLAPDAEQLEYRGLRSFFLPPGAIGGRVRELADRLDVQVLDYEKLYDQLMRGEDIDTLLPAIAFWQFGTLRHHPEPMVYMDDAESYLAGGYRFTLLAVDPDEVVAAYLVDLAGYAQ